MKELEWVGSSRKDLRDFPDEVQDVMGYALDFAQRGDKSPRAKPLTGYGGASVLEIVDDYDGDTYRAVYTVKFEEAVYVLHCFQKKSTQGIKTSKHDLDLIDWRLKIAEEKHKEWLKLQTEKRKKAT
jgi:phage-related protein